MKSKLPKPPKTVKNCPKLSGAGPNLPKPAWILDSGQKRSPPQDFIRRTLAETGVEKETPPCIAFFSIFLRVSYNE